MKRWKLLIMPLLICFLIPMAMLQAAPLNKPPDSRQTLSRIAAPGNLMATVNTQGQIELAWQDNSANEAGFKIERRTASGSYSEIKQLPASATKFIDTGAQAGNTYVYRVRAFTGAAARSQYSPYSNEATATVKQTQPANRGTGLITPPITARPGASVQTPDNGSLDVTVADGNTPVAGAEVSVTAGNSTQTKQTSAQGVASFSDLLTGNANIYAKKEGYVAKTAIVNATIAKGAKTTVAYAMIRPTARAQIHVRDSLNIPGALAGATVIITGKGISSKTGLTDAAGNAAFADLPYGDYYASAAKDGYIGSGQVWFKLSDAAGIQMAIPVTPMPFAEITVHDISGAPVTGASVTIAGNGQTLTGQTDASGLKRFERLTAGQYTVAVSKAGYESRSGLPMTIAAGAQRQGLVIGLNKSIDPVSQTVTIIDSANLPIPGATISMEGKGQIKTQTTDAQGTAVFSLQPATYNISIAKDGYWDSKLFVTVESQPQVKKYTLTRKVGKAEIVVSEGAGKPLAGAQVTTTSDGKTVNVVSNGSGIATFDNLPLGSYSFTVTKAGYSSGAANLTVTGPSSVGAIVNLVAQIGNVDVLLTDFYTGKAFYYAQISTSVNGQTITKTAEYARTSFTGLPIGNYSFTASRSGYKTETVNAAVAVGTTAEASIAMKKVSGSVNVTVTDFTTGAAIAGATVTSPGAQPPVQTTDAQGVARFTGVPAQSWGLQGFSAKKDGYQDSANVSLYVPADGVAAVELKLKRLPVGSAVITVVDRAMQPIPDATVSVKTSASSQPQVLITNSQGIANFASLPEGYWPFTITKSGYVWEVAATTNSSINSFSFSIVNGQTTNQTITLVKLSGTAVIIVKDAATGAPIQGASVISAARNLDQTTNSQGMVTFTNLASGHYTFTISFPASNYDFGQIGVDILGDTVTRTVTLRAR